MSYQRLGRLFAILLVVTLVAAFATGQWYLYVLCLALAFALVAVTCFQLLRSDTTMREGVQGLAAALSCIALLIGGYWYFVERRGIPKVNVEPQLAAWAIPGDLVLVRGEVRVTNVGVAAVRLDTKLPIELELGQVMPPAGKQLSDLTAVVERERAAGKGDFALAQTDRWPLRASNYEGINSVIEAGETENLYYKAVIPCTDGLVLALTAKVPKNLSWLDKVFEPNREQNYWTAQEIAEVKGSCVKGGEQA